MHNSKLQHRSNLYSSRCFSTPLFPDQLQSPTTRTHVQITVFILTDTDHDQSITWLSLGKKWCSSNELLPLKAARETRNPLTETRKPFNRQSRRLRLWRGRIGAGLELDQSTESLHSRLLGSSSDFGVSELGECSGFEVSVEGGRRSEGSALWSGFHGGWLWSGERNGEEKKP